MKRHLIHYLFSTVILVILVIPITTTVHQGGNDNSILTDSTKNIQDSSVVSSNWLAGWGYRKSHQILGTPGAGVNYQVEIIVNFGAGTDSGNTVYCDSNCQSDFDDIRFTDDDGITLLDYWRETYVVSDNATFWVEVQDNLDSNVSIYVYMSNSTCSTASNGTATFLFFDDFNDDSIDTSKWETYGPWTESGGFATISVVGDGSSTTIPSLRTDSSWDMRNKSFAARWQFNENSVNWQWGMSCKDSAGMLSYFLGSSQLYTSTADNYFDLDHSGGGYDHDVDVIDTWPDDIFFRTEFSSTPDGSTKNEWLLNHESVSTYNGNSFTSNPQYLLLGHYSYGQQAVLIAGNLIMDFDWVYLRNQVGLEVTHDTWSDTESILEGWDYRISHVINGAVGAGTNYQIEIIVHYGYGTSSGKEVYCAEKCQPDFDDIRFTDDDGITLLDYWTESITESNVSIFWVEVADDLSVDTTIYMYFGNSTASTLSNGTATFIFFDDFETGSFNGWDEVGYDCEVQSSVMKNGLYSAHLGSNNDGRTLEEIIGNYYNGSFMVHLWARMQSTSSYAGYPLAWWGYTQDTEQYDIGYSLFAHNAMFSYTQPSNNIVTWPSNNAFISNTWYRLEAGVEITEDIQQAWKNREYMGEALLRHNDFDESVGFLERIVTAGGALSSRDMWIDDFYIRKWTPLEPVHGAWGESIEPPVQASITDVEDFWYEVSESGNMIEWSVANFNPTSYELWRDGGLLTSESWPEGTTIEFNIDNLSPGEYNYTIVVYGDSGIVVSDTVIVSVMDLTIPSLGHPSDVVYEYGTTGHTIIWSASDLYPGVYAIAQDATAVVNDFWTSGSIVLDIDGLSVGEYTYTILISDISLNTAFDTVTVTVVDTTAPILNHPSDIIGNIASASFQISWQPTDLLPFNYAIFENGTQVDSGTWTSGEYLNYTLDVLTLSSYNITIVVWDTSGNYARDTVLVNIQEESIQPIGDILVVSISIGSIGVIVVIVGLICRNKGGVESGPPDSGYSW